MIVPDDPRDPRRRRSAPFGVPIIERRAGSHSDHTGRPHMGVRAEDEMTPVTMITIVRDELNDKIAAVDGKVDDVASKVETLDGNLNNAIRSMERLTGEVSTTNELIPKMLDAITGELRARRSIDEKIKTTESEITRHRELSAAETEAIERRTKAETDSFVKRTKAVTWAKIALVIFGPTVLGAIIGYYFAR